MNPAVSVIQTDRFYKRGKTMEKKGFIKNPKMFYICAGVLAVLLCLLTVAMQGFGDTDFFWHNALGRYMVENKKLMEADEFSWLGIQNGYTEYAHSYAGSLIIYLMSRLMELLTGDMKNGVFLISAVSVAGIYTATYKFFIRDVKEGFYKQLCAVLFCIVAIFMGTGRPQAFSNILFVILVGCLYKTYSDVNSSAYLGIPVIALIWANVHGGSVPIVFAFTGFFLLVSFTREFSFGNVSHTLPKKRERSVVRTHLTVSLVLSLIAGAVNPYGISLYTYGFIRNNSDTKKYIAEWGRAGLTAPSVIIPIIVILLVFILFKKFDAKSVCMMVGLLVISGFRIRYSGYMMLMCIPYFSLCVRDTEDNAKAFLEGLYKFILITTGVFIFAVLSVLGSDYNKIKNNNLLSDDTTAFLQDADYKKLYSDYDIGGYLIWNNILSFVDSRADLFSADDIQDNLYFARFKFEAIDDFDKYLEGYDFDGVLLNAKGSSLTVSYLERKGYTAVCEDDNYIVLEKQK